MAPRSLAAAQVTYDVGEGRVSSRRATGRSSRRRGRNAPQNAPRNPENETPVTAFACDDGRLLSRGDRI
jgi:hypothetical protein